MIHLWRNTWICSELCCRLCLTICSDLLCTFLLTLSLSCPQAHSVPFQQPQDVMKLIDGMDDAEQLQLFFMECSFYHSPQRFCFQLSHVLTFGERNERQNGVWWEWSVSRKKWPLFHLYEQNLRITSVKEFCSLGIRGLPKRRVSVGVNREHSRLQPRLKQEQPLAGKLPKIRT